MEDLTKKYYRIGEVAELLGLPVSTVRYWESEFPRVKPRRNDRGTRYYTPADVERLRVIRYLVKDRGMKIEAARASLRSNREGIERRSEVVERLRTLRSRVEALLQALDTLGGGDGGRNQ